VTASRGDTVDKPDEASEKAKSIDSRCADWGHDMRVRHRDDDARTTTLRCERCGFSKSVGWLRTVDEQMESLRELRTASARRRGL